MKHLNKIVNQPAGVTRAVDSNSEEGDTEIIGEFGHIFKRNNREWRVSVVTDTFILGTATDAKMDDDGPVKADDIINVAGDFRINKR